ncbi:MAG: Transcriptional regulator, TrmB [Parcubacteria group bacterium GW2011_GWC2_38_7]|nr:MAG: Transcriptional regulator, TrmB [Parcubacteria group bacterium GW2011_GWC2_38_7]
MQYTQVLESLGFSPKEIYIYTALLELETATATDLAKKTEINRTSCYDILSVLIKRGLVSKIVKKKKIYFHITDPRKLLNYLDREKEEAYNKIEKNKKQINEIMPELLSLFNPNPTKPRIQFYEGEKGMREAYEDTLTADKVYYAYANFETMYQGLPNFFPNYYERRIKAKILGKGIFPKNKTTLNQLKNNQEELRESIVLGDESLTYSPEVIIYNNKVLIASWKEKIAIIIESKELADLQKIIFQQLWVSLQKDPKNIVSLLNKY